MKSKIFRFCTNEQTVNVFGSKDEIKTVQLTQAELEKIVNFSRAEGKT